MKISRRSLIGGLSAFIAAPAIIRVADLMPVRAFRLAPGPRIEVWGLPGIPDQVLQGYVEFENLGLVEANRRFADSLIIEPHGPRRIDVLVKPEFVNQLAVLAAFIKTNGEFHGQ